MTAPLAAASDLAEIERVVRASGTSFYRGMAILPPDRRSAMYAIYAFCRVVDDIADEPAPIEQKLRELGAWRDRIGALSAGVADSAITRVLLAAQRRFGLRAEDFLAIIDGMQMDAETVIVAPDLAVFDLYCDRVASAVGRLSVRAFGDASVQADRVAHHLGRALQMTNVLRDIAEDAGRGRLYLPREWLQAEGAGMNPERLLADPALAGVCERMAQQARRHFAEAKAAMQMCDRAAMRPARLMAATYAATLGRLERRGWLRLTERVAVPRWQKLWILLRHGLLA